MKILNKNVFIRVFLSFYKFVALPMGGEGRENHGANH